MRGRLQAPISLAEAARQMHLSRRSEPGGHALATSSHNGGPHARCTLGVAKEDERTLTSLEEVTS
jgi:hypothetical protein